MYSHGPVSIFQGAGRFLMRSRIFIIAGFSYFSGSGYGKEFTHRNRKIYPFSSFFEGRISPCRAGWLPLA
ncbi:MAG TPA: hypothetical protein DF409_16925, partial [Bacteroidales bacterium]|nr:hypothetical protein [Bacteroidales bacterium]